MKFKGITIRVHLTAVVKPSAVFLTVANIIIAAAPATIFAQESASSTVSRAPDPLAVIPDSELSPPPPPPPTEPVTATRPASLRAHEGEVLTTNSFVRERMHEVDVEMRSGLAMIRHSMTFMNRGTHPSEVRVRIPAPRDSDLAGLRACVADQCHEGHSAPADSGERVYREATLARGGGGAPVAFARRLHDSRGEAFFVWATPVPPGGELSLTVRVLASAPSYGGVQRLEIPARGADARVAETAIRWIEPLDGRAQINGVGRTEAPMVVSSWQPISLTRPVYHNAQAPLSLWRFVSGGTPYLYAHASAPPRRAPPRHLIVLVDLSPSSLGPTSNRRLHGITGLLAAAPQGSKISIIAFATRAQAVFDTPRAHNEIPLSPIQRTLATPLGNRTMLHETWPLILRASRQSPAALRPILVLLGDGAIPRMAETPTFQRALVDTGLEFWTVALGDEPSWNLADELALRTGGRVLHIGTEAEAALDGNSSAPLVERLRDVFAPPSQEILQLRSSGRLLADGRLLAGSEWRWIGQARRGTTRVGGLGHRTRVRRPPPEWTPGLRARARRLRSAGPSAAFIAADPRDIHEATSDHCRDPGPAFRHSGIASDDARVALAERRRCDQPLGPVVPSPRQYGLGIPAQTVLTQLRSRVIPPARACLRSDRRGRANHSIRATFHLEMGRRELIGSRVEGDISPTLRTCLLSTLETMDIPTFRGWIRVRYPIYTEVAPEPEVERGWDPEP